MSGRAFMWLESWAGRSKHEVEILGKSAAGTRYRVRLLEDAFNKKAGRVYYPPLASVTFEEADADGAHTAREWECQN